MYVIAELSDLPVVSHGAFRFEDLSGLAGVTIGALLVGVALVGFLAERGLMRRLWSARLAMETGALIVPAIMFLWLALAQSVPIEDLLEETPRAFLALEIGLAALAAVASYAVLRLILERAVPTQARVTSVAPRAPSSSERVGELPFRYACGQAVAVDDAFCTQCGARQVAAPPAAVSAEAVAAPAAVPQPPRRVREAAILAPASPLQRGLLILAGALLIAIGARVIVPATPDAPEFSVELLPLLFVGGFLGSRSGAAAYLVYVLAELSDLPVVSHAAFRFEDLSGLAGVTIGALLVGVVLVGFFAERGLTRRLWSAVLATAMGALAAFGIVLAGLALVLSAPPQDLFGKTSKFFPAVDLGMAVLAAIAVWAVSGRILGRAAPKERQALPANLRRA